MYSKVIEEYKTANQGMQVQLNLVSNSNVKGAAFLIRVQKNNMVKRFFNRRYDLKNENLISVLKDSLSLKVGTNTVPLEEFLSKSEEVLTLAQ